MEYNKLRSADLWKPLAISALCGLGLAAIFLQIQYSSMLSAWRRSQEIRASSDLHAALELASLVPQDPERIQTALKRLAPGGEFRLPLNLEYLPTLQRLEAVAPTFQWSSEAGGYSRLRSTIQSTSTESAFTLTNRFGPASLPYLKASHWMMASVITLACALVVWLLFENAKRWAHLRRGLQEWGRQLDTRAAFSQPLPISLQKVDAEIGHSLEQISQLYQQRLSMVQSAAEQSTKIMLSMQIGVLAFDGSMRLLFMNRAGAELLGLDPYLSNGKLLVELLRQPTIVNLVQRVNRQGQPMDADLDIPLRSTTLRLRATPLEEQSILTEMSLTVSQELKTSPPVAGVLLTVTDETRLRQLENMRRDFTANVSHELKTPLSAIKAYAETLLMGAIDEDDAKRHFVERINEQANRLDELIRDLLQLTRIQSQPECHPLEELLLDELIRSCVNEHQTIGKSKKVTLDTSAIENNCRVRSHVESLRTIIDNLLSNAIRYNREGGWVKIRTTLEDNFVKLSFEDSGIGIPPEDIQRIFERFYRVEKARNQDTGGTGLGLSIVKHLSQSMSIPIHVQSELGRGSTFELSIPRVHD